MRAKSILAILFLAAIIVFAALFYRATAVRVTAGQAVAAAAQEDEVLVATAPLAAGTLLRAQDVTWRAVADGNFADAIFRPSAAMRRARPDADDQAQGAVFGAALRAPIAAGRPIRQGVIVRPGDRDFLQVVLSPGTRAIAIPVATGGASTGLLHPGDRVDVILTQNFKDKAEALARRSVGETIVEDLRVVAIDRPDAKAAKEGGNTFGPTVTLEATPEEAIKVDVATDLGKLLLALRSVSADGGRLATSTAGPGKTSPVKAIWAGDVSPALGAVSPGAQPNAAPDEHGEKATVQRPPVDVIRGSKSEAVKPQ